MDIDSAMKLINTPKTQLNIINISKTKDFLLLQEYLTSILGLSYITGIADLKEIPMDISIIRGLHIKPRSFSSTCRIFYSEERHLVSDFTRTLHDGADYLRVDAKDFIKQYIKLDKSGGISFNY